MLDFQLFRIKVLLPAQMPLAPEPPRSDILRRAVVELPSAELRKNMVWHIGNAESVDSKGLYFRLGRTTTTTVQVYDNGKFQDQAFETAPYTHVLVDVDWEICAIARKPKLSPSAAGISRQLTRLLNASETVRSLEVNIEIGEINDPEDFINHLRTAYSISKYTVWFTQPNPWDAQEDFLKPAQKLVRSARGKQGKTEIKGSALDPEVLADISRSAAATGDDAHAWLKPTKRGNPVKKRLRGSPVNLSSSEVDTPNDKKSVLDMVRQLYQSVRQSIGK